MVGKKRGGKGMNGKGGQEDFRAFPQFQICHYTTVGHVISYEQVSLTR